MNLEVLFTPAEFAELPKRDLSDTVCVVFDVLRATSTFVTALNNGAKEIIPVAEILEALEIKRNHPDVLLAGERGGVRISANGIDFDLGNSPREFVSKNISRKTIVSTTTNGTRALRACANAKAVLAASFLNLRATADFLKSNRFQNILLVCAGTGENAAFEDTVTAGALCELISEGTISASAKIALDTFIRAKNTLVETVIRESENARRLLTIPELRDDVEFCLQRDLFSIVAKMQSGEGKFQSLRAAKIHFKK